MVTPERLNKPTEEQVGLGVPWAPVRASVLTTGERRLEARSYLTDGYGQRQLIESAPSGWQNMQEVADVWQPSRLKGVVVRPNAGLPFLSAGQVFESAPVVRKWLAQGHVPDANERFVAPDWILMSCSGRVGRITAVYSHHENIVVTHDLLRIVPHKPELYGWLYAYMRTSQFNSIANSAQYGHMIKHLEPEHVRQMPVVMPSPDVIQATSDLVSSVMAKRREASQLVAEANSEYEVLLNPTGRAIGNTAHGIVSASALFSGRRRLDAEHFRPDYRQTEDILRAGSARPVTTLDDVTESVSLGSRFRRYFGEKGTPYRSAEELFDLNAPVTKRIYAGLVEQRDRYTLRKGWIIMACSGQVYGLNGRTMLLTNAHDGLFGSHDLIRIAPDENAVHTGYLLLVLGNPTFGRPLAIRHAYGTSIPHLDPVDIRKLPIPRFDEETERRLGEKMIRATELKAVADAQENEVTDLAETVLEKFIKSHGLVST